MTKTRYIGFIAALSIGLMGVAQAQDSATVDALATLQQATAPLALAGETSLSFGSVNIPNGTEVDHACGYTIAVSGETPQTNLTEYNQDGFTIDTSVPTPSGCDWGSSGTPNVSYGTFAISCNPSSAVDFTATWSNGGATEVWFQRGTSTSMRAFSSGTYTALATSSNGSMTATCPNNGIFDVAVGGQVRVGANATAGSDVTVGTVTLEATY